MKSFPLKLLLFFLLLPPAGYGITMAVLQEVVLDAFLTPTLVNYFHNKSLRNIDAVMQGDLPLKAAVARNIEPQIRKLHFLRAAGVELSVAVLTRNGTVLYPRLQTILGEPGQAGAPPPKDKFTIARENLALTHQGLVVHVRARLNMVSLTSAVIFAVYLVLSALLFYRVFRQRMGRIHAAEKEREAEIRRLHDQEREREADLEQLRQGHGALTADLERLRESMREERRQALKNEDGMVAEIELLERRISENLTLRERQQAEIETLQQTISHLEKNRKGAGAGKKEAMLQKRFHTLYKNLRFTDKAVSGFANLAEDQKIKCEEIIHHLNEDASLVPVKRKVFGKKGRQTILEVVFGYRGRLYFRKTRDGGLDILAAGTKNTQNKDLEYLNKL